jgi:putative tryptophan/tyrosine transport system substrate-binding protein
VLTAATLIGGSAVMVPGRGHDDPMPVVAWVDYDVPAARQIFARFTEYFNAEQLGDGKRVVLKFVGADVADSERLSAEMSALSATQPAVIVATSLSVAKSLMQVHSQAPVYFVSQSDPVREGLVTSLIATGPRTGYTFFMPLDVKTMELIHRVFPQARTVGVVTDALWLQGNNMSRDLFTQSRTMGLDLILFQPAGQNDIRRLLQDARAHRVEIWYVPYTELAFDHGADIVAVLGQSKLPTVYGRRKYVKMGGLMSIQTVDDDAMQVWARSIANILNGVPVGRIPVMRPKEIEIAVNSHALALLDQVTRDRIAREATTFE